jgi:DNA-binding response OmpR family regulator
MAKKVLLIDDDKDLVQSLEQVIKMNNYDVSVAYSGSEGLKKVLSEKPDLVILDVMMENDTAGFEAAYQIRSALPTSRYKEMKNVPIIMLTAITQVTNSRFSLNDSDNYLPAINDFLTKPVKVNDLLDKVKKFI